jgi:hypothetical protein
MIRYKYYKVGELIYQRVIENKINAGDDIMNLIRKKYKSYDDTLETSCFYGNYNDMIKTINFIIDNNYSNKRNISLISPKSTKYIIKKSVDTINTTNTIHTLNTIDSMENKTISILQRPTPLITNISDDNNTYDNNDDLGIKIVIKTIEKNAKESIENIKKYIDCLSYDRIVSNNITIGHCLQNIDDNLYDIWNSLNNNTYVTCMSSPSWIWNKMQPNVYNIGYLKYWATIDNPEKVFNIIENDIIRSISKVGDNISPYNLAMVSYKHFKYFHIYTNDKWYYYDIITNKWEEDINRMNIMQSLISNISIIFEKYTNYDNIVQMYNDPLFIDEVLNIAAKIFFNKNNYSSEYIANNLIRHKLLP